MCKHSTEDVNYCCALTSKLTEAITFLTCIRDVISLNLNETLTIVTKVVCSFPQSLEKNAGIIPQIRP
jgi:hypothetical protein